MALTLASVLNGDRPTAPPGSFAELVVDLVGINWTDVRARTEAVRARKQSRHSQLNEAPRGIESVAFTHSKEASHSQGT
jgi:hypothetical protein